MVDRGVSKVMLVATVMVIIGVAEAVSALTGWLDEPRPGEGTLPARIKPAGQLNTLEGDAPQGGPVPAQTASARNGQQVYEAACQVCHGSGAAGAPKLGDRAAWMPRIQQGMEQLVAHAIQGFSGTSGVMPPRGMCGDCSDAELRGAVEYMIAKSK